MNLIWHSFVVDNSAIAKILLFIFGWSRFDLFWEKTEEVVEARGEQRDWETERESYSEGN